MLNTEQIKKEWLEQFEDIMLVHHSTKMDVFLDETGHSHYQNFKDSITDYWLSILSQQLSKQREEIKELSQYCEHTNLCIRYRYEAGRPTDNGGYEIKFNGKWYESSPIDKTPKCNCGLEETLKILDTAKSESEGKEK